MAGTYCEFILSLCKTHTISSVCAVESTKEALLKKSKQEFNGCKNVISDNRLYRTLVEYINDKSFLDLNHLNNDSQLVCARCCDYLLSVNDIEYNKLFDTMVDINWLLASSYICNKKRDKEIILLRDYKTKRNCIKEYLHELYNSAINDYFECLYIDEAFEARKKILIGFYQFKYEESKRYISQDYDFYALNALQQDFRKTSISKMALFYGLTATAALENDIRRRV